MDYEEAIGYIFNLKIYGMSLGLERIEHLLKELGSPHVGMNTVHVAGTNGKGSVCAMLSSILQSAGYKVGLFTSPHLVSFGERILVNGEPVPEDRVVELILRIKPIAEKMRDSGDFEHPTFFEIVTAMALEHFRSEHVDMAVLEVGLGGRLDATNVVSPLVSVITTIALDHTHVLGEDLEKVAREKAGIIKPNVPVVTGIEQDEILDVIKKICETKDSQLLTTKSRGSYILKEMDLDGQTFDIVDDGITYENLRMGLLGEHQLKNAQVALITVNVLNSLGISCPESAIREGFLNTRWPARMQIVQKKPIIIMDCAHNPAGMRALRGALKDMFGERKLILVMGIMRDKDIPGIVKEIAPSAHKIIITKPEFERAADPQRIEVEARKYSDNVEIIENVVHAVDQARSLAADEDVICIAGSIFNVGEAISKLDFHVNSLKPP